MMAWAVGPVCRFPAQHLVGHGTERVLVGPGIELPVAGGLLRAHVVRGAERESGLGDPGPTGLCHRERDPEIGDHRLAGLEQDVLRLEIAMDDAVGVGVIQRGREQGDQPDDIVHRQFAFALEPGPQGLAFDVRHDVIQEPVRFAGIEQRQQVGVLQVGGDPDLGQEPLGAEDRGEFGPQHLERDLPLVLQILGQVDRGHPAGAEFPLDPVAVGEGRGELGEHGSSPLSG